MMPRPRDPKAILIEIRAAFDGDSIPMKNVMLRYAADCIEDLLKEQEREAERWSQPKAI
jgi:hypothetical protein